MAVKPASDIEQRLKKMLTRDKMGVNQGFKSALSGDLRHLLSDYFSLEGEIELNVNPLDNGDYEIKVVATAKKIKSFHSTADGGMG